MDAHLPPEFSNYINQQLAIFAQSRCDTWHQAVEKNRTSLRSELSSPFLTKPIKEFFYQSQVPENDFDRQELMELILHTQKKDPSLPEEECIHFLRLLLQKTNEPKLDRFGLTKAQLKCLVTALQGNTSVTSLNLSTNSIDADGIRLLAAILKENHTLKTLDLGGAGSGNHIADDRFHDAIKLLIETLACNDSLEILKLNSLNVNWGYLGFKYKFCQSIATLLEKDTPLKELHLSGNHFENNDVQPIANALKNNVHLKVLNLSHTWLVADSGASHLADMLEHNNTLIQLDLDYCSIDDKGVEALLNGLKKNLVLTHLNLKTAQPISSRSLINEEIKRQLEINMQIPLVMERAKLLMTPAPASTNSSASFKIPPEIMKKIIISMTVENHASNH